MLSFNEFKEQLTEAVKLSPADKGILSAVFDDNKHLGDDDILSELEHAIDHHDIAKGKDNIQKLAHDFLKEITKKKH